MSFEVYTWAAGLAEATCYSTVFATAHVPPWSTPVMAAKQSTTIDHISGGRFALNIVCGWAPAEFAMFGSGALRSHDEGYEYAEEWTEILAKLWTAEDEFDYQGDYFEITGAISKPGPDGSKPSRPIASASSSAVGLRFAAKHADMSFVGIRSAGRSEWERLIPGSQESRQDEFGRSCKCGPTALLSADRRSAGRRLEAVRRSRSPPPPRPPTWRGSPPGRGWLGAAA